MIRILLALAVLGAATVPAQAALSLNDAVKVIESFRVDPQDKGGQAPVSFVAPPRSINDITEILDKQKPDPAKRAAALTDASRQVPSGASPLDLAAFHYNRGIAAGEIGRQQQRVDDLNQAYKLAQQANAAPQILFIYLQQLGFAYSAAGNFKDALAIQEQRLELVGRYPSPQATGQTINIYQNKILLAVRAGQLELARTALGQAEKTMGTLPPRAPPTVRDNLNSQVLRARAAIAQESGQYADAEAALRNALALVVALVPREAEMGLGTGTFANVRDAMYGELALTLARQGRLVEAESEVRRSLLSRLDRRGRYASETGLDILLLGRILFEQGRYVETERLADASRDVFENLGQGKGSAALANARRWVAQAQMAQGKHDAAAATYEAVERDVGDDPDLRKRFLDMNINYALVLMRHGRVPDAIRIMEAVVAYNDKTMGDKAYVTAQARGWLAVAYARSKQNDRAAQNFAASIPILLSASREADDNDDDGTSVAQRDRLRQQIVEAYLGFLADTRGAAAAAEAFQLADAVRGRSVERALAASSARTAASDSALADLVRHEQDAQKQTAALRGLLTNVLSLPSNEQDAAAVQKLRKDIDQLRDARARVREEIEKKFPDYANLISPRPATVEQAQKSLRTGEALIATYVGDERLFVWAVPQQGPAAYAAANIAGKEIERIVGELRKALDPNAESLDGVPAFDVALGYRLYELLLKPVEAGWANAQSLMIVPHKALGQLPTGLLVTEKIAQPAKSATPFAEYKDVPFLIRKVAVTQLPSVASLATLRALPAAKGPREAFIAFGDPWFSPEQATEARAEVKQVAQAGDLQTRGARKGIPLVRRSAPKTDGVDSAQLAQLPRLPDTAEEVRSIAIALHADVGKDILLGAAANEKAVKTMDLSRRRVVMFATHGLVPGDLDGLTQPALALSAPAVANIDGDGLLTMEEVLALKLNADWVVLSACNTATGAGAGAEAVSGLGRAFFYAGTRALLVSNWPVETVSARTLTTDLFRRQADDPKLARGEAMRQAELALIDGPGAVDPATGQTAFTYAHPIFWAPFTVVGDGGASAP